MFSNEQLSGFVRPSILPCFTFSFSYLVLNWYIWVPIFWKVDWFGVFGVLEYENKNFKGLRKVLPSHNILCKKHTRAIFVCHVETRKKILYTWLKPAEIAACRSRDRPIILQRNIHRYGTVALRYILSLRFCHRYDGRYGFEQNISCCTVSYTALPMKTDLHFQTTLS